MPNCVTNGRGACRPICSERWLRTLKYCLLCLANPVCSTILARPLIFEGGGCPNHCFACPAHPVRPSVCPSTKLGPLHSNKLPSETFAPWYFLYWFCFHNKYMQHERSHRSTNYRCRSIFPLENNFCMYVSFCTSDWGLNSFKYGRENRFNWILKHKRHANTLSDNKGPIVLVWKMYGNLSLLKILHGNACCSINLRFYFSQETNFLFHQQ